MNWTPHPILSIPSDEDISLMDAEELIELYTAREEAIKSGITDKLQIIIP